LKILGTTGGATKKFKLLGPNTTCFEWLSFFEYEMMVGLHVFKLKSYQCPEIIEGK